MLLKLPAAEIDAAPGRDRALIGELSFPRLTRSPVYFALAGHFHRLSRQAKESIAWRHLCVVRNSDEILNPIRDTNPHRRDWRLACLHRSFSPQAVRPGMLLHFVQLLVNQQCQESEQKHARPDAEHPHRNRELVHFRQQFCLFFL